LVVVSEITEQVRLNEQVNRTERLAALGELASGLAHEIKNPLTSMHGFVQMLPERSDDQDFVEKTADILDRECKRLDELIENLHSYAKPQVGQRQEFELKELIEETLTLLRKEAEKSDVELKTEVPDGTKVFGDPSKIKQVIMNLSLNGIEAMRDGGVLQISCERTRDDYVRMKIQDEGVGMEEDELERIFNPFYTTKEDGTGLGMSISHRIVEDHGGLLRFDSAPKQGTTAEVLLPRQESSPPIERSSYLGE
jgi:signal transduction histidine kinase